VNRHEESEYPVRQRIGQEQPKPSPLAQVIAVLAFAGFLILTPTIIDRLGK